MAATTSVKEEVQEIKIKPEYENFTPKQSPDEYKALLKSIKQYGQLEEIIINQDGIILDGHHRFKACRELGIEFIKYEIRHCDSELDEISFINEINAKRRHYTHFQRVVQALNFEPYLEKIAKQNMSLGGKLKASTNIDKPFNVQEEIAKDGRIRSHNYFKPRKVAAIREIRRMIIAGTSHVDIQRQLNLPEKTYYRYLNSAFAEDRERMKQYVTVDESMTQLAIVQERLNSMYQNIHGIALNSDVDPEVRIEAESLAAELAVGILKSWEDSPLGAMKTLKYVEQNSSKELVHISSSEEEQRRNRRSQG